MTYPHPDDMRPPEVDPLMPLSAPDWLWAAWEEHELEWQGWELTFAEIQALPVVGREHDCPEEEWVDA